jgi:hypothetical protein
MIPLYTYNRVITKCARGCVLIRMPLHCICHSIVYARDLERGPWFLLFAYAHELERGGYTVGTVQRTNHPFAKTTVICAICPGAEAVRGWHALNRSMICTVGTVAPGAGFLCLNERVSQVHSRRVRIVEPKTTSLKRETSRRPNFFIFRPIEVPKEPR